MRILCILFGLLCVLPTAVTAQELVVTFGGDVNFARSRQAPKPDSVTKGKTYTLEQTTQNLQPYWQGDLNFINVETVVAEKDGQRSGKTFVFRTHPAQMQHLMDLGVNAFALANNHSGDHGAKGLTDTLAFFDSEAHKRDIIYAGVGDEARAFAPSIAEINGYRIALSALSFGSNRPPRGADRPGIAYLFNRAHFDATIQSLKQARADLKILSIHYGTENLTGLNAGQRKLYHKALEQSGAHLILGHHPHVVRPVEIIGQDKAAIFYSLGNLLFIGGANKDGAALGGDYGLLGKAYFSMQADGPALTALEVSPLKGVHLIPRDPRPKRAIAQLRHLNRLSKRHLGEGAAHFDIVEVPKPYGMMCLGGHYGRRAQQKCCENALHLSCDLPSPM